jgi:hypothetical protein
VEIKVPSGEVADESEECIIANWRKGDPCNEVAKHLADCVLEPDGRYKLWAM